MANCVFEGTLEGEQKPPEELVEIRWVQQKEDFPQEVDTSEMHTGSFAVTEFKDTFKLNTFFFYQALDFI